MGLIHRVFTITPIAVTSLLLIASIHPSVYGQASVNDAIDQQMQEVTVTVQRREQNILDVPYNITAVSGDDVAASFTRDSAELLRSIPGVSQIDQGPRNAAQFSSIRIRGLNVDSSANSDYAVASVATVSTYVNETPVYANLALIDLDRVEVLRGPQATLYGSGALGGTVKYFLNEPVLGEIEGAIGTTLSSVRGSNYRSIHDPLGYTTSAIINYPLSDTIAVRANLYLQDYPGITDYVNLYQLDSSGVPIQTIGINASGPNSTDFTSKENADTYRSLYSRIALSWVPSDDIDILATFIFQEDDVGGRRAQSEGFNGFGEPYNDYEQGAMILEPSERTFDMFSLEATIELGFTTLTSATSYFSNDGSSETDNTGFYANNISAPYLNYPRPLYTAHRTFLDEAVVQELRLVGSLFQNFDYVIGGFYQDNKKGMSQRSDLVGFESWASNQWWAALPNSSVSSDNIFTYQRNENYTESAAFGEITFHANDRLRFTFGARHFEVDSQVDTLVLVDDAWDCCTQSAITSSSVTEHDLLLKGNIALDFSDDELLYLTISEGYRRGGNNAVPTIGTFANDIGWTIYNSDSVINYEIGIKGIINSIRFDLSAFRINWQDPQFNTSTPIGAFFSVINGDEAKTQGAELQLSGSINERLSFAFGYAYVDAQLTSNLIEPSNDPTNFPIASEGASLPGVPMHAINLAFDYFQPLTGDIDLALRLDGFHQSKTLNVIDESIPEAIVPQAVEFDSFEIWDASASLLYKQWTSSFFIKNIFNERGVTGSFTPEAFGPQANAEFYGSNSRSFIALPRTFGLAINYQF